MNKSNILQSVALGTLLLTACAPTAAPAAQPATPESAVTGTVTYLQRSALPPTAVIEVVLQDVSKMDAPAETISSQRIEANGKQVPFPYELKYDPAQIDQKNTYAVRATIKDGDKLLFTSTTHMPVITNGAPTSDVEIIVEPVASSGATSQSVITGTVTYRNRSALPPTAVIEVTLAGHLAGRCTRQSDQHAADRGGWQAGAVSRMSCLTIRRRSIPRIPTRSARASPRATRCCSSATRSIPCLRAARL